MAWYDEKDVEEEDDFFNSVLDGYKEPSEEKKEEEKKRIAKKFEDDQKESVNLYATFIINLEAVIDKYNRYKTVFHGEDTEEDLTKIGKNFFKGVHFDAEIYSNNGIEIIPDKVDVSQYLQKSRFGGGNYIVRVHIDAKTKNELEDIPVGNTFKAVLYINGMAWAIADVGSVIEKNKLSAGKGDFMSNILFSYEDIILDKPVKVFKNNYSIKDIKYQYKLITPRKIR